MLNVILFSSLLLAEEPTTAPEGKPEVVAPATEPKVENTPKVENNPPKEKPKEEAKEVAKEETKVPSDYNEAAESVSLLVKAVQDKNWALVVGLLLTLLVFVANKFGLKDKVGAKAVPWVATGTATLAALGVSLANGLPVTDAISQGILAGLTAIGGWEMLFKHILAPKTEEVKEG